MVNVVTVHAGHGGAKSGNSWTDPGAVGSGYLEANVARTIAAKMASIIGAKDITDNTSTNSNAIINTQAARINANADGYHISNHLNAFNGSATGVEVLYGSASEKPLAAKLSAAIAKELGIMDRGAKDGSWLGIARLTGSGKKVLLIEWGFIDNSSDMKKLMSKMDSAVAVACKVLGYGSGTAPAPAQELEPSPDVSTIIGGIGMFIYWQPQAKGNVSDAYGVWGNKRFYISNDSKLKHFRAMVEMATGRPCKEYKTWARGSEQIRVVESFTEEQEGL